MHLIKNKSLFWTVSGITTVYIVISLISLDFFFFWDNIQYSSVTANWYYDNNFSSLVLPFYTEELKIVGAGSISLMGLSTAFLWEIFGQELWVSHIYILFWALIIIYNTYKLLFSLLPKDFVVFAMPVLLLESAILAQTAIASIDIVLLALFLISLRCVINNNKWGLVFSSFLLINLSGRGLLTGIGILLFSILLSYNRKEVRSLFHFLITQVIPFIPGFVFFLTFFFYSKLYGSSIESPWAGTWENPENIYILMKNFFAYGLRLVENGRFIIWLAILGSLHYALKQKKIGCIFQKQYLALGFLLIYFLLVYLYFALTTKMIISTRYYIPLFFILTIISFHLLSFLVKIRFVRIFTIVALISQLTGHLWVYPDKIAQSWDATLAHIPFYQLRKDCFDYIDDNGIDYSEVSGGFSIAGHQYNIDLKGRNKYISRDTKNRYFIYSNISNLSDDFISELNDSNKWEEVKSFKKGYIFISLYRNLNY